MIEKTCRVIITMKMGRVTIATAIRIVTNIRMILTNKNDKEKQNHGYHAHN